LIVAFVVVAVIMIFVIPAFKQVFSSLGRDYRRPTLVVIAMSEFFVSIGTSYLADWIGGFYFFMESWKRNEKMQRFHGSRDAETAYFWCFGRKVVYCTVDTNPVHHVCSGRSSCGSAGLGRRSSRKLGL
jgi:hypothetical protein